MHKHCRSLLLATLALSCGLLASCLSSGPEKPLGAMADAMEKMCSNRARMLEMGRIGQKRVELYYQQQFMLKNYQAVYDELREYHGRKQI